QSSEASSRSKPTISPFSSRKPIGGKLSSRPKTNSPLSFISSQELSATSPSFLQPESTKTITSTAKVSMVMALFKTNTLSLDHFVLIVLKKEEIVKGRCDGDSVKTL